VIKSVQPRSDGHAQRASSGGVLSGYWVGANYGPIFAVCGQMKVHQIMSTDAGERSLQRRFPIVDILFRSGDIRDRSAKSS